MKYLNFLKSAFLTAIFSLLIISCENTESDADPLAETDASEEFDQVYSLTETDYLYELITQIETLIAGGTISEGNANALRLLTHQFNGRRKGGFALTYSSLASVVKYPYDSTYKGEKKYGFFQSEKENYKLIANGLGINETDQKPGVFVRHPLVYLLIKKHGNGQINYSEA